MNDLDGRLFIAYLQNVPDKEKGEEPRHPPPIAGFSSFCNLLTEDKIPDITKKVNPKLSLLYNTNIIDKYILHK